MEAIAERLAATKREMQALERRYGRAPGSVRLLAVSKTKPVTAVTAAYQAGQRDFGENHLQDALTKIEPLADYDIRWHFIGPIQSNKTRGIAERFSWVHSVDRLKVAERLSVQRPTALPPLNVCLQVNASGESSKSGVAPEALEALARSVQGLPHLVLRGIMALPRPSSCLDEQRRAFAAVREMLVALNARGLALDTLSMGMTNDLEAAVAEGATIVRIGTAIFGPRD